MTTYRDMAVTLIQKNGADAPLWQMIVLGEETGEAMEAFRKMNGQGRKVMTKEQFAQELADVIITVEVLALLTEVDLHKEVNKKLDAIEQRGGL